jgi:acyl-CoA thioesterase FadM
MARVRIDFPEGVVFRHQLTVRVSDLNYGNHLGHDGLVSLLHEARVQFFRSLGVSEMDCDGTAMVIADLAVRYRSEALAGQELVVEIAMGERRRSSCELLYRMSQADGGAVVAEARTGLVFVDPKKREVAPLPQTLEALY